MTTTACPPAPKMDPRVQRTRRLLTDAFQALMQEKAFADISVGDIAERATVNRATFYAHFEDKRHLATSNVREHLQAALHGMMEEQSDLSVERLVESGRVIFETIANILGRCPKVRDELGETVGSVLQESIETFFSHWLGHSARTARIFPGASPQTVASALSWSLYGGAVEWSRSTKRPPASVAAREIVLLFACADAARL